MSAAEHAAPLVGLTEKRLHDALRVHIRNSSTDHVCGGPCAADILAALRASEEERPTHGRHCPCSACAREDWTDRRTYCGMHGPSCPAVYAPVVASPGQEREYPPGSGFKTTGTRDPAQ